MRNDVRRSDPSTTRAVYACMALLAAAAILWSGILGGSKIEHVVIRQRPIRKWVAQANATKPLKPSRRTEDFVFALFTGPDRSPLAKAGRAWRQGCRTVVATDIVTLSPSEVAEAAQHNETWISFPDNDLAHSSGPADFRGSMVLVMAHRIFKGNYKWMLWGDDDTIWFPYGARRLLHRWDHSLPHAITDNFWPENHRMPGKHAARCMPCHASSRSEDTAGAGLVTAVDGFTAPLACPVCTTRLLCDNLAGFGWHYSAWLEQEGGGACINSTGSSYWPEPSASLHGGTGMAFSIAALEQMAVSNKWEKCVHDPFGWNQTYIGVHNWNTGGDAVVTRCLWLLGIGITDTGTAMEGPFQPVTKLEWWNFTAKSPADFKALWKYEGSWERRERKRLFGGSSHSNRQDLNDMLSQWSDDSRSTSDLCSSGGPWCRAELAWVLRMVSSHSKAAKASDRRHLGRLMQQQYQAYQAIINRVQPPLYELVESESGVSHAALDAPEVATATPGVGSELSPRNSSDEALEKLQLRGSSRGQWTDHFVFAVYTTPGREALVQAGRAWRQGCRTVVVTSKGPSSTVPSDAHRHNETWIDLSGSKSAPDIMYLESALLPVLAHRVVGGRYKWMMWAADDVMWFPPGLTKLLGGWMDHTLPHAISDNFWPEGGRIPGKTAVRCMPCRSPSAIGEHPNSGHVRSENGSEISAHGFTALLACPVCSARRLCESLKGSEWRYDSWFKAEGPLVCEKDPLPWPQPQPLEIGKAGLAISFGAAARIADSRQFEECVRHPVASMDDRGGPEGAVARCLWGADIGITDTGTVAEGPHQPLIALAEWDYSAPWNVSTFDWHAEFSRGWRRQERNRLFGGGECSSFNELGAMIGQWDNFTVAPPSGCHNDDWCLAELESIQRMVSTGSMVAPEADVAAGALSLRQLYAQYDRLLQSFGS